MKIYSINCNILILHVWKKKPNLSLLQPMLQASRVEFVWVLTVHTCISLYQLWGYFTTKFVYVWIVTTTYIRLGRYWYFLYHFYYGFFITDSSIMKVFKFNIGCSLIGGHIILSINNSKCIRLLIGHIPCMNSSLIIHLYLESTPF
jgi:hypothetical protein